MIYLFIMNIALLVGFITYVVFTQNERWQLIELIAAKDYTDYKKFESKDEKVVSKDRKNMFSARNHKENMYQEQE